MAGVATEVRHSRYGIALALYPGDARYAIEIERAPDSAGSPDTGNSETIAIVGAGTRTYTDLRSGGRWHYRARHVRSGATAGSWTQWINDTPAPIPSDLPNIPPLEGPSNIVIWVNDSGEVVVSADGPEQTQNLYVTVGDGSSPSDPTSGANDGSISGRSGTVNTGVMPTVGNTVFVKVVAEDLGGNLSAVQEDQIVYNDVVPSQQYTGIVDVEGGEGGIRLRLYSANGGHVVYYDTSGIQQAVSGYITADDLWKVQSDAPIEIETDHDIHLNMGVGGVLEMSTALSLSAGSASGNWLQLLINGTTYKVRLYDES